MKMQDEFANGVNFCLISLYGVYSLGARYLYSVLKERTRQVNLIFFKNLFLNDASLPTEQEYKKLFELLEMLKVDFIGINAGCSSFFKIAAEINYRIKRRFDVSVIWGGILPTLEPEKCIKIADFICLGEGEHALPELLFKFSRNEQTDDIENIWSRKGNGSVTRNKLRPLIQDLDSLPFPDLSNQSKYFIENEMISYADPVHSYNWQYYIMTSRGCPYACEFCIESFNKKIYQDKGRYFRRRSVDNVIAELVYAKNQLPGIKQISFFDDIFTSDLDWVRRFSEEYRSAVDIPFWCFSHPLRVREEVLPLLKIAGVSFVDIGVQSGSAQIRKNIFNRPESNLDILEAVKKIQKYDIMPYLDFIVDNPFDTVEDKHQTLELLFNLPRPFNLNLYSLIFFPEYNLTNRALKEKLITEQDIEGNSLKVLFDGVVMVNGKRPRKELVFICLISLLARDFIPHRIVRFFSKKKNITRFPWFQLLIILTMLSGYIRWVNIAFKYFHKEKFNPFSLKRYWKYLNYVIKVIK